MQKHDLATHDVPLKHKKEMPNMTQNSNTHANSILKMIEAMGDKSASKIGRKSSSKKSDSSSSISTILEAAQTKDSPAIRGQKSFQSRENAKDSATKERYIQLAKSKGIPMLLTFIATLAIIVALKPKFALVNKVCEVDENGVAILPLKQSLSPVKVACWSLGSAAVAGIVPFIISFAAAQKKPSKII